MKIFLEKLKDKKNLTFEESVSAFEILMTGKATEDEIFSFLTLLSDKGEIAEEIAGGVYILRNKSKRVKVEDCVDTCGTGGDGKNTLNINLEPREIENEINKKNFGFMFAPNYHSAMKYVGPTRKKIGKRTIFNMIGPLSSPALEKKQVVGVFDKKLLKIFGNALKNLKIKFAWIVNSEDGLDEISPYAKTNVIQLKDNQISEIIIDPKELNINSEKFENLLGDNAKFNAKKIVDIFNGEDNDFSKAVCLNAGAGLIVSEKFNKFKDAYQYSREHILSGKTFDHLKIIQNG